MGCRSLSKKLSMKGDFVNYQRGPLLACAFEDRKLVVVLSTHGSGRPVKYMSRENRESATPDCIHQYDQYRGGVDLSDMRIYFFQGERRTKWNVKICFLQFGQTLFNAFIVYQSNTAVPMSYCKFLDVDDLVCDFRMPHSTRHKVLLPVIPPAICLARDDKDQKVIILLQMLQHWIMCCRLFLVLSHPR